MSLATPQGTQTQEFGRQSIWEPTAWHYLDRTARFQQYPYAVRAVHYHLGDDRAAGLGTPVRALEAGVITQEGWAASFGPFGGGGITIEVAVHGGMLITVCHCRSSIVNKGQRVARGQIIGYEGATGTATGSHKHIALSTINSYGQRTFHNLEHYLAGGMFAASPLIRPAPVATVLVAIGAPGDTTPYPINLRAGAGIGFAVKYTSAADGIHRHDGALSFKLTSGFVFSGWVKNGIGEVWARIKTGAGEVLYVRSDLLHAIAGKLPARP